MHDEATVRASWPPDGEATLSDRANDERRSPAPSLMRGDSVGRYIVLEEIGRGGMGVVYAAFDPQLDRKLAIKLVRPEPGPSTRASEGRQRLLREAQALARLAHPNVVAIHDVGEHAGQVFIAMEFVAGQTLTERLRRAQVSWRKVLDWFIQAGRGVTTAHAAGILHRDFKPDNVMIGNDGRVRVMDFGLARPVDAQLENPDATAISITTEDDVVDDEAASFDRSMTRTGALLGTPAYMAPEQLFGETPDPRTDQFSFCVALWEALYGRRPYVGETLPELVTNVCAGRRADLPANSRVPRWIRRVLERGLSVTRTDRFEDMPALLRALESDPTRRRRRWFGLGVVVVAGLAGLAGHQANEARYLAACADEAAAVDAVWGPDARAALEAALLHSNVGHGPSTWERLAPWLDDYAQRWRSDRNALCLDARQQILDGNAAEHRRACFDESLTAMSTLVEVLGEGDEAALNLAVQSAASLPDLRRCADTHALRSRSDPSTQTELLTKLRGRLVRATTLRAAGRYADAHAEASELLEEAQAAGADDLAARAQAVTGGLRADLGDYQQGHEHLTAAFFRAGQLRDAETAVAAATDLVRVAREQADWDGGRQWARHGSMWLEGPNAPPDADLAKARLWAELGALEQRAGDHDRAEEWYARALQIERAQLGDAHPSVAGLQGSRASLAIVRGEYRAALTLLDEAIALSERALGPDHPRLANLLNLTGIAHDELGDYEAAESFYRKALETWQHALGEDHPSASNYLQNLGNLRAQAGKPEEALEFYRRALALVEPAYGADHPRVADLLTNIGASELRMERYEDALQHHRQALIIMERALGPEHGDTVHVYNDIANAYRDRGELSLALENYERAHEGLAGAYGTNHPLAAMALANIGLVESQLGHRERALEHLQAARGIFERELGADHPRVAAVTDMINTARERR